MADTDSFASPGPESQRFNSRASYEGEVGIWTFVTSEKLRGVPFWERARESVRSQVVQIMTEGKTPPNQPGLLLIHIVAGRANGEVVPPNSHQAKLCAVLFRVREDVPVGNLPKNIDHEMGAISIPYHLGTTAARFNHAHLGSKVHPHQGTTGPLRPYPTWAALSKRRQYWLWRWLGVREGVY